MALDRTSTWFITGASSGFGRALASAALDAGARVVATARDPATLAELEQRGAGKLLALRLDVTDSVQIEAAVATAERTFGAIDVVVNNAGYGLVGAIEEAGDAEIQSQLDVHFFASVRILRAVLPGMRARRRGYIVNMSSLVGVRAIGGTGYYAAAKFALEGLSEALRYELAPLGIGVLIVEPGSFRTDYANRSLALAADIIPDYSATSGVLRTSIAARHGRQPGDPARAAAAIIEVVLSGKTPGRLVLGSDAANIISAHLQQRLAEVEQWRDVAAGTDFPRSHPYDHDGETDFKGDSRGNT